ncbi:uncharacterized protein LOC131258843 [Anopheles coustani]|uniref:uncharacterized protein LOC131258843 n=1 Tax=Anopheles coustani TaxID=139045 RepID=UPI0026586BC1|nr:uncharacterized protein LOC131258843 [Anopheles coustani]
MTVLLSYHRIVEKEPSQVNPRWKTCTVVSLLAIVSSCVVVSFSLHGLIAEYKHNCLLEAHLKFIPKPNLPPGNTTEPKPIIQYGIDEYWSNWSSGAYCETLKNMPLFQGICCTIWLAIFLMHGPGGILPQPWRIVFPSLIFFLGCLATSLTTASFITRGLNQLCAEFQKVESLRGLDCGRLVVYFALSKESTSLVQVDKNFFLTLIFPWVWFGATCLGFFVILLRIILMVDFQLLRVVISKHGDRKFKDLPEVKLASYSDSECLDD